MKNIILSPWDRITTILKNETLCANSLALRIGLRRAYMIQDTKHPQIGIIPELAARINYVFPAYSIEWLLTGVGPHPATKEEAHPQTEVSIIGRWAMIQTLDYWNDGGRRGSWVPGANFNPGEFVWEFKPDGLLDQYEAGLKVATVLYAFDQEHGWLLEEGNPALVEKLTPVELEFIDWSDMEKGPVSRVVFKKEEFVNNIIFTNTVK